MAILANTIGSAKWLALLLVAATTASSFSTSAATTTTTATTASVRKTGAGCGELLFSSLFYFLVF
jgi:hypothetical protein